MSILVASLRASLNPPSHAHSDSSIFKPKTNMPIHKKKISSPKPIINIFSPQQLHHSVDPDQVFVGNFAPVSELPPTECSVVHGSLPRALNGVYIRAGPNPQHSTLGPLHFFEGDGMLHSVKISNGRATLCSRYVETYKYTLERHAGTPLFPNVFSGFHGLGDVLRCAASAWRVATGRIDLLRGFGLANTSLSCFANKLLALCESDLPYVITVTNNGDIKTIGRWDFNEKEKFLSNMTAHPKIDHSTGETFAFRCSPVFPYITFFKFDPSGAKINIDVPIMSVNKPTLIHDFGLTDNFIILPETQLVIDPTKLILGQGMPLVSDNNKVPRIGVMPRYDTSDVNMKWFETPGFNAMHVVNAWEEGDNDIVVVASNTQPIGRIFDDIKVVEFPLEKLRIDTRSGQVTREVMSGENLELGCINPAYAGKRSRYAYMGICEHSPRMSGVVKIDVEKGCEVSRRLYGKACFGGEPLFVGRDRDDDTTASFDEDDGYVVTYVHDEETRESRFVVMDAKSPELEIVAVVKLPRRVPYGFHGIFVSDKQLQSLHVENPNVENLN